MFSWLSSLVATAAAESTPVATAAAESTPTHAAAAAEVEASGGGKVVVATDGVVVVESESDWCLATDDAELLDAACTGGGGSAQPTPPLDEASAIATLLSLRLAPPPPPPPPTRSVMRKPRPPRRRSRSRSPPPSMAVGGVADDDTDPVYHVVCLHDRGSTAEAFAHEWQSFVELTQTRFPEAYFTFRQGLYAAVDSRGRSVGGFSWYPATTAAPTSRYQRAAEEVIDGGAADRRQLADVLRRLHAKRPTEQLVLLGVGEGAALALDLAYTFGAESSASSSTIDEPLPVAHVWALLPTPLPHFPNQRPQPREQHAFQVLIVSAPTGDCTGTRQSANRARVRQQWVHWLPRAQWCEALAPPGLRGCTVGDWPSVQNRLHQQWLAPAEQ